MNEATLNNNVFLMCKYLQSRIVIVLIKASISEHKNPDKLCPISVLTFSFCETLGNNLIFPCVNVFIYKVKNKIELLFNVIVKAKYADECKENVIVSLHNSQ